MPEKTHNLAVSAPAKVNLHLAVLDKRPDGFHNIESIFLAVDLADTLHFELVKEKNTAEIVMESGSLPSKALEAPIPLENNIIFKALSLFRTKTGFTKGLNIKVEKQIPVGGGLGGGSSNAASALLALNELAGSPLSLDLLLEMGASLGSDVPFFLHKAACALVTGRGEKIEALSAPRLFLTLVNPGFTSDTAAAYRLLDKKREVEKAAPSGATVKNIAFESFESFNNDFLQVFEGRERAVYDDIISRLRALGAEYANLSGSGSTCFGIFGEKAQAEHAAEVLRSKWEFSKFCCSYENSQCEHCN